MTSTLFRSALAMGLLTVCMAMFRELQTNPTTTKRPMGPATYWITYSKTVRPGHPMIFQVQIFQGSLPVDMYFTLKDSKGADVIRHGPVSVTPKVPSKISIPIPFDVKRPSDDKYYWQQYTVHVTGNNSENAIKEKGVASYEEKAFSIFVQTDKAMYKPSQTVQFRTLAMTPDMKVLRDVKQDIVVFDARGNRILQVRGVEASAKLGVFEKSFKLASSVPTGNWKIKVTIEGIEEEKEFEVADYVLPRFEVEVDGSSFGVNTDLLYEFTVKAKYTFGKPVTAGTVLVEIAVGNMYYNNDNPKPIIKRGELDNNGELTLQVTLDDLLRLGNSYNKYYDSKTVQSWWDFAITANVTETRTGRKHSGQHIVKFHNTPIQMKFLGITPNSFKSGLDYTAYLEIKKQDGTLFSPLELKQMSVNINVTYSVPESTTTTTTTTTQSPTHSGRIPLPAKDEIFTGGRWYQRYEQRVLKLDKSIYSIPETGWIVLTFRVPDEARELNLKAQTISPFAEEVTQYKSASKSYSPTESFLQLSVINKKPRVGDMIEVVAKSTDQMTVLNYQVFSKGLLVASKQINGPSNNMAFQFEATASMSPSMSIVAFYVRDDGEFVVDALSVSVDGLFDNAVKAEFTKEKVKPGEAVNLVVKGEKDSVVFLLVVDKSVKLLKSGNDITQDMVREELASYDYGNYGDWRYMFICGWPSYFGGNDAKAVFENAGVEVMTDGLVYSRYQDEDYYLEDGAIPTQGAGIPESVPDSSNQGNANEKRGDMKPAERTRKYFPENWLWNIEIIDSSGQAVVPLTSPDTITTWLASVFSVSTANGLSVAEKPAEVITFRDMFISLDLPSTIVRGEDFCFPASVFSYYKGELPVLLTMEPSPDYENIWARKEDGQVILEKGQMQYSYFLGFMKENAVKTVRFCFTPVTIGSIAIKVSAMTNVASLSDAVERKIRVKPEGIPHSTTNSYIVTPTGGSWTENVPVTLPKDTVLGSERISVNIAGNLLGPIFDNLDDLLQKPYGCGEQNMINFSPIMSLVDFFFTTNSMTDEFRQKAVEYMLIGYQKEILYEHGTSGGYSTFGNNENTKENPSMWLTAFVTKCFSQAEILDMKYGNILAMDVDLIHRSADWMVNGKNQQRDGSFVEHGKVFNKGLQGGSSNGIALTAYTVVSLFHSLKVLNANQGLDIGAITRGMEKAVLFLETNYDSLTDPYDVCITTYALTLVDSPEAPNSLVIMEKMAKKGFGMTNWERPQKEQKNNYYWSRNSDAINIEMTSYALLTYSLLQRGTTDGLPILRWLSKQKGPNGGFISTQDTVIGIEALTSVAKDLYGAEFVPMTITVSLKNSAGSTVSVSNFEVTKDNEMILQRKDIAYQPGSEIQINAQTPANKDTSKSTVLVDLVFHFNVLSETRPVIYGMDHEVMSTADGFALSVKIWTTDGKPASMSLLEVDIPAGHHPDMEAILEMNRVISRVDVKDDRLNVYIDTNMIDGNGIKVKLPMLQIGGKLIKALGKSYKISSYYEPDVELTKKYFMVGGGSFCSMEPEIGICKYE